MRYDIYIHLDRVETSLVKDLGAVQMKQFHSMDRPRREEGERGGRGGGREERVGGSRRER